MSQSNITPDQILDAIQLVPVERWDEVLRAIANLQESPVSAAPPTSPVKTGTDLRDSDLIGIWADRIEVGNSREFARDLRRQAEQRHCQGRPDAVGH
jgi:hypothetical protein